MNLLLLTDIPPCRNFTAGIFLENLISFRPKDSVSCFSVLNPFLDPQIPPELSWMPITKAVKPAENSGVKRFGRFRSLVVETYHRSVSIPKIADRVVEYARSVGAEAILAPIQGQTMIHLALLVAKRIQIPIYPLVYDPPGWWLRENNVHPWIARQVLRDFEKVLRFGTKTSCCSWAMSEYYQDQYQVNTVPVIASLDKNLALDPATHPHSGSTFTICLAGQMYSSNEWGALIAGLNSVGWKVAGKNIKITVLGPHFSQYAQGQPMNIEFLGWRTQEETLKIFANSDLLYCPYWFDPAYELEARLSFPSKLTTYLASGRPVLFHGPAYASPAQFLEQNKAAVFCHALDAKIIIEKLEEIITNGELYRFISRNGRLAFDRFLTMDCMRRAFDQLLGP